MSQRNDFKAFSISNNANVVSQEGYEESRSLKTGFPPDDITVHLLNKVLRQSSTITSVLANFIATYSGNDVLDDGDLVKLATQLSRALEQKIVTEVPNASLTQKGVTQLTDKIGNSNTLAVTQKLVSDVNDNANNRLEKNQNGADIPDKNAFVKNLGLGDGSGRLIGSQIFYSSGTYTPSSTLVKRIIVEAVGGGGGSAGLGALNSSISAATGAGASGSYARTTLFNVPASPIVVTIGAGGSGGTAGVNGGNGGETSFGGLVICPGGKGSPHVGGSNDVMVYPAGDAGSLPTSTIILECASNYTTSGVVQPKFNLLFAGEPASTGLGSYGRGGFPVLSYATAPAQNGQVGANGLVIVREYS
ncbi:phage tail protein [Photorhabdus luminescens]|uniref:phage tail protein n=1 Tax=Photorhabdus luminescens TaxID=29488 RepID=UPI00210DF178|nr:phage tail protein [Photorhabdus luminescens]